jgi:hypothetical protein
MTMICLISVVVKQIVKVVFCIYNSASNLNSRSPYIHSRVSKEEYIKTVHLMDKSKLVNVWHDEERYITIVVGTKLRSRPNEPPNPIRLVDMIKKKRTRMKTRRIWVQTSTMKKTSPLVVTVGSID